MRYMHPHAYPLSLGFLLLFSACGSDGNNVLNPIEATGVESTASGVSTDLVDLANTSPREGFQNITKEDLARLTKSNELPEWLSISGTINTGTNGSETPVGCHLVVRQEGGPDICLFGARNIALAAALSTRGERAFALYASETIVIEASLFAFAGANYNMDSDEQDTTLLAYGAGGAGGGFGSAGGAGGNQGTSGHAVYGNAELSPLLGGTSGGGAGPLLEETNLSGTGGGAVQLLAEKEIRFTNGGAVFAQGHGGAGHEKGALPILAGGRGGGSGGGILLQTPHIVFEGAGTRILANGGAGGGGTDFSESDASGSGENGSRDFLPARPGEGNTSRAGSGGQGAARNGEATEGASSADTLQFGGGGGGGGYGRIRIDTSDGSRLNLEGVIISPAPSLGTLVLP